MRMRLCLPSPRAPAMFQLSTPLPFTVPFPIQGSFPTPAPLGTEHVLCWNRDCAGLNLSSFCAIAMCNCCHQMW